MKRVERGALRHWFSAPVRLKRHHLVDIFQHLEWAAMFGGVRVTINGDVVPSLESFYEERYQEVRWAKFETHDVVVHLGPRSLYVYTRSAERASALAMVRVVEQLQSAVRRGGELVLRAWGGLAVVALTVALCARIWASGPGAQWGVGIGVAGVIASVFAAAYFGLLRRVVIVPWAAESLWRQQAPGVIAAVVGSGVASAAAAWVAIRFTP